MKLQTEICLGKLLVKATSPLRLGVRGEAHELERRGRHVTRRPFPPPGLSSRSKEPSEAVFAHLPRQGKQYNGLVIPCANLADFSLLWEGLPSAHPLPRLHAPHLRSRCASRFSPIAVHLVLFLSLRHTGVFLRYHASCTTLTPVPQPTFSWSFSNSGWCPTP